jgi:hypothetical protein
MNVDLLLFINAIVVILGGILAVSALIVANKPDAKNLIDKLVPFQAVIGVGMIGLAVVNLVRMLGALSDMFRVNFMWALGIWTLFGAGALLGLLFGMPLIAKMVPGQSAAEQKVLDLSRQIAPFQVLIGLAGIGGAVLVLLYQFKILK